MVLSGAAITGGFGRVTYKLERSTTDSVDKFTKTGFVRRVAGLVCGVGHYHPQ